MNSEEEIGTENSNVNRDVAVSLMVSSHQENILRVEESEFDLECNEPVRQTENLSIFTHLKQSLINLFASFHDWWICTSIITKTKLLGFVFLPCLAVGLYIFHYTQNPGTLHNPVAVLHPLFVVHPVIPSPLNTAVKFIKETGSDLLKNSEDVPVHTNKGPIVGKRFDPNPLTGASYDAFLGIPYGHIHTLFQQAGPVASWTSPRPTQTDGLPCPQPGVNFTEDCLFMNIFTPKGAAGSSVRYPVIAFIHGSAFTFTSASSKHYGPDFLVPQGVILVTFNYRLGAVGFLTLGSKVAPGNMGLYDTQLALRWVQDEIAGFGGDPSQVTLMGQSAGAILAMFHYLSPASAGLFRYVIAQSGSALSSWGHYTPEEGASRAKSLASAVGCNTSVNDTQLLTCLQETNINYIVGNQSIPLSTHYEASGQTMVFLPVLDTSFADRPFFNDTLNNLLDQTVNRSKPMILGFTADEGIVKFAEETCWKIVEENLDSFIPVSAQSSLSENRKNALVNGIRSRYFQNSVVDNKVMDIVKLYEDHMLIFPTLQVARKLANTSYGYMFAFRGPWTPDPPYIAQYHVSGVNHGFDLEYLFYHDEEPQDLGNCSSLQESFRVRDMMVSWWTNFVKTGIPGGNWSKISQGGYLKIDSNVMMINASTMESDHNYLFWSSLQSATETSSATFPELNFLMVVFVALWCVLVSLAL